jgi:hypothetical protein
MMAVMARRRDIEGTPAPGELELVRSFLSVHDHRGSGPKSLPPSPESLREFFVEQDLIDPEEPVSDRALRSASLVHTAMHGKVEGRNEAARTAAEPSVIDQAAREAGLELHFGSEGPPRIEPTASGIAGALGRILAAAFLAQLDGTWQRLKECSDDACTSVFYDRSKNHSGKWCSMRSCGNRNKVRAWRERQHSGVPPT